MKVGKGRTFFVNIQAGTWFSPTPLLLKTGPIFGGCLAFNSEPPPSPEPISKTLGRFDSRHIEVFNDIYEEMGEK